MSVVDLGHNRSGFWSQSMVFSQALQGAFSLPHKVDARQDSSSSMVSRTSAENDGHADTPARSSSNALAFLTRGKPGETSQLQCKV